MSDPGGVDDQYLEAQVQAQAVSAPMVETSKLAVFSALAAASCIPGVSLLGIPLGLLALRQINASQYVVGANLAWLGILGGAFSALGWLGVGQHVLEVRSQADEPVAAFMSAWTKAEADGEAAADPGLAPLMRRNGGTEVRKAMVERMGEYQGLGPREAFVWDFHIRSLPFSESFTVTYRPQFKSGAPLEAVFDLARGDDKQLRVVGYRLSSPVLRDLDKLGLTEQHAQAAPSLHAFDAEGGGAGPKPMREFNKK